MTSPQQPSDLTPAEAGDTTDNDALASPEILEESGSTEAPAEVPAEAEEPVVAQDTPLFTGQHATQIMEQGFPAAEKPSVVYLLPVGEPFSVQTNEGLMSAQAGDYVAHDPKSGHVWPVAASYIAMHYEFLSEAQLRESKERS